jgi:hypothetical protein
MAEPLFAKEFLASKSAISSKTSISGVMARGVALLVSIAILAWFANRQ